MPRDIHYSILVGRGKTKQLWEIHLEEFKILSFSHPPIIYLYTNFIGQEYFFIVIVAVAVAIDIIIMIMITNILMGIPLT